MKKVSLIVCIAMIFSIFISSFSFASAATTDLSATRYRLPWVKFEIPGFKSGQSIADGAYKSFVSHNEAKSVKDLFLASVESYDFLRPNNKALKINMISSPASVDKFLRFDMTPNKKIQTTQYPLKDISKGIPRTSTENGFMFFIDFSKFSSKGTNSDGTTFDNEHTYVSMKPLFQEVDYNPDGSIRKNDNDTPAVTPWTTDPNKEITLVWTISANWKYIDGTTGQEVQLNVKPGDKQVVYARDNLGGVEYIQYPAGFCGYVLIPFDSLHPGESGWKGIDTDGMINLQKIDLACFNFGLWPYQHGEFWMDEISFYGPAFAEIDGALDYGANLSNTNFATTPTAVVPKQSAVQEDPDLDIKTSTAGGGTTQSTADENSAEVSLDSETSDDISIDTALSTETSNNSLQQADTQTTTKNGGFPWWGWVIIGVVVIAGAGCGVFFFLKKKNAEDNDFENLSDDIIDENLDSSDDQEDLSDTSDDDSNDDTDDTQE